MAKISRGVVAAVALASGEIMEAVVAGKHNHKRLGLKGPGAQQDSCDVSQLPVVPGGSLGGASCVTKNPDGTVLPANIHPKTIPFWNKNMDGGNGQNPKPCQDDKGNPQTWKACTSTTTSIKCTCASQSTCIVVCPVSNCTQGEGPSTCFTDSEGKKWSSMLKTRHTMNCGSFGDDKGVQTKGPSKGWKGMLPTNVCDGMKDDEKQEN